MVRFIPLGDRIKIKQTIEEKFGLIYLPGGSGEKNEGEIVAMGDGVPTETGLQIGMLVTYGKYAGFKFREGKDTFQVMDYGDVLGKLEGEEEIGADFNRTLEVSNSTKTVFEEYAKGE